MNINIKTAEMNRLIVEYKIKEWTECPQSLHKKVKTNFKEEIISLPLQDEKL